MNSPVLWRDILRQMPDGSIIAGGAIRDFFLHKEPKDIDVFIPQQDFDGATEFLDRLNDDWVYQRPTFARAAEYLDMPNVFTVMDYQYVDHQVQLMFLNEDNVWNHFRRFDLSTSMGCYSTELGLQADKEMLDSFIDNRITVRTPWNNTPERRERSIVRARRVQEKYPEMNFTIV